MTTQVYSEVSGKIIKNKKEIERVLGVKITVNNGVVFIRAKEGKADRELLCLQVIEAINLGFSVSNALLLSQDNYIFEKIHIRAIEKREKMEQVRGRVIGRERKVMDTIESLTDCYMSLHKNTLGIIGRIDNIDKTVHALKRLIAGSDHASVYAELEKLRAREKFI